jgi:hypothetical protein
MPAYGGTAAGGARATRGQRARQQSIVAGSTSHPGAGDSCQLRGTGNTMISGSAAISGGAAPEALAHRARDELALFDYPDRAWVTPVRDGNGGLVHWCVMCRSPRVDRTFRGN